MEIVIVVCLLVIIVLIAVCADRLKDIYLALAGGGDLPKMKGPPPKKKGFQDRLESALREQAEIKKRK